MTQINAYLKFNGNTREAFEFYKECLGGELTLQAVGDSPMAGQMPKDAKDKIIHAKLVKDGLVIMGSDMMGDEGHFIKGNNIYLCINGGTAEELKTFFSKLSAGGNITQELKEAFFGTFGELTDKFGMQWMFQADKEVHT